jgi:hypothetical protein
MKTQDYERLEPRLQEVAKNIVAGIKTLQMVEAQRQAQLQSAMAESQGMQNAAAPQGPKPPPSTPQPGNDGGQPPLT